MNPINLDDIQSWLEDATGIDKPKKQIAFMVISMVSAYNMNSKEVTVKGLEIIEELMKDE